ncbi:MAG: acetamidase/formamidase family protein [Candidatus Rokubacteria bacterium]|nr:acetamidase/formamidase family protein [Candidatus Rokubacteria bacterium]
MVPVTTTHTVSATDDTVTVGRFEIEKSPVATIDSGDWVSVETRYHYNDGIVPGMDITAIANLRRRFRGRGPHSVTGPIYVKGAEPGDVLEIRIRGIRLKSYGFNFNLPGEFMTGAIPEDFPTGHVKYFDLDGALMSTRFAPGVTVTLAPYPGILGVGPPLDWPEKWPVGLPRELGQPEAGSFSTVPPGPFGGNLDNTEWGVGAAVFLPVFHAGALVWTGDSHCKQGDGEVNLTAIECAFGPVTMQIIVRKDRRAEGAWAWPIAETRTHWIVQGLHTDLDEAVKHAVRNTIDFLVREKDFTRHDAYAFASVAVDYRITQVVDIVKGVHGMIPKAFFDDAGHFACTLCDRRFAW